VRAVHVVLPDGVDDPERASGGNVYDRRVCCGLAAAGWFVREHVAPGTWPLADRTTRQRLRRELASVPDGAVVVVDGLVASAAPEVLVPAAPRLRLCVLVHLPLGATTDDVTVRGDESVVLQAVAAVVTTSGWSRRWLLEHYGLDGACVHVAEPGVDAAPLAPGTATGGHLLCVASVSPGKGHDLVVAALAGLRDLPWHWECVGSLRRDPDYVERLRTQIRALGVAGRIDLVGPRTGAALAASYAAADLVVLASRFESYGMVVTEALARGIPVLATAVGGLPATVGRLPDGRRPGLLVPPEQPAALVEAAGRWLRERALRESLGDAARLRRATLAGWDATTERISRVLAEVAA
jgi:glycosyltransferase involved in cell wall biosynthesis